MDIPREYAWYQNDFVVDSNGEDRGWNEGVYAEDGVGEPAHGTGRLCTVGTLCAVKSCRGSGPLRLFRCESSLRC